MAQKKVTVSFESGWILSRRADDVLPVELFLKKAAEQVKFRVLDSSMTDCVILVEGESSEEVLKAKLWIVLREDLKLPEGSSEVTVKVEDWDSETEERIQKEFDDLLASLGAVEITEKDQPPQEQPSIPAEKGRKVLERIEDLVGAEEFKALARECVEMAPIIYKYKTFESFTSRCYLFSIDDGGGLTTYLEQFAKLLDVLELYPINSRRPVREIRVGPPSEEGFREVFREVISAYTGAGARSSQVLCVDISEWLTATHRKEFRDFLAWLEDHLGEKLLVFRVPFVEKEILKNLRQALEDRLYVREVSFLPFDARELEQYARKSLNGRGFDMEEDAWRLFHDRMTQEKCDGRFYGINTVEKVVREMICRKQLHDVAAGTDDALIKRQDIADLVEGDDPSEVSAMELLADMVGMEGLRYRVDEIIAQIEMILHNPGLGSPCLHMRFVGNPGTGKTTVARVVGKILKEKGILRVGGFFEHSGRDFCGRYVGQTAPKTSAMCRDAYGSVLFIDEAYSLYRGDGTSRADFGREALDTLIAEMENHRNDMVVIMAGYPEEMERLMEGNSGLSSRMPYIIEFPNYSRQQLFEIYMKMAGKVFTFGEGFRETVQAYFDGLPEQQLQAKEFSNARFVRNLFERTWGKAALRAQLTREDPSVLLKEDFLCASSEKEFGRMVEKKPPRRIGFQ